MTPIPPPLRGPRDAWARWWLWQVAPELAFTMDRAEEARMTGNPENRCSIVPLIDAASGRAMVAIGIAPGIPIEVTLRLLELALAHYRGIPLIVQSMPAWSVA